VLQIDTHCYLYCKVLLNVRGHFKPVILKTGINHEIKKIVAVSVVSLSLLGTLSTCPLVRQC